MRVTAVAQEQCRRYWQDGVCESTLRTWLRPSQEVKINNLIILFSMTNEIEKVKAYATRLEEILSAVTIDANQRLIVNALIGEAKQKYDMYNN